MDKYFGYCRISRKEQSIDRQIRNISKYASDNGLKVEKIYQEAFTGTKIEGRKQFELVTKRAKQGDTIIFDSVSRMSRNAAEGIELYFELYEKGVNLVFLKERHIDTDSYKKALESTGITIASDGSAEGNLVSDITAAITRFMKAKASDDILKAFEQAEKEVQDLHDRTREGIETARLNGKQIGQKQGAKLTTKKSIVAKEKIMKHCADFGGTMKDKELMEYTGLARNTYYKYKRELKDAL